MNRGFPLRAAIFAALVVAAALWWVLFGGNLDAAAVGHRVREAGTFAPLIFVAAFAAATVFFLPGSLFGLAGGLLFGPLWGGVWNLVGATLGATIAFLFARFLAGGWIARRSNGRVQAIVAAVNAEGWRFVAFTRLVPLVPFNVLNYALGITRIPVSHYVVATIVCMAPGAAAFAWLGHAGLAALEGDRAALRYGALGLAVLALVAFAPRLVRRIRESSSRFISVGELKCSLAREPRPVVLDVREPDEFSGALGHISGARNIPLAELAAGVEELKSLDRRIVVVCRTDKRSLKAAALLRKASIRDVTVLRGGIEAWNAQGSSTNAMVLRPAHDVPRLQRHHAGHA